MEKFVVSPDYYKNVLCSIYKQGQDRKFSDVTLKCRDSVFYGHKCILSTESEYFNTLFQGNFSDSNNQEIDLSSVFEDEKSFEQIMKFFYIGEVDFSDILLLARYAEFFQIWSLMTLCETKMKACVGLHNCITYYMFSKSTGYYSIEEMTSSIMEQRFHDYFIHKDDTLQLSPSDLQDMFDLGCLAYCQASDILEFIAKWLLADITVKHIELGQQVLDYLKEREQNQEGRIVGHMKSCIGSYCCKLETELKASEMEKDIVSSFIHKFESMTEQVPQSEGTSSGSEERVLFTLSKRKKIDLSLFEDSGKDTPAENFISGKHENWRTVYDVCLYRPCSKLWYNVESIDELPDYNNDNDILPKSARLLPFHKHSCKLNYIHGKLMFSSRLSNRILIYNCEEKKWHSLNAEKKGTKKGKDEFLSLLAFGIQIRQRNLSTIGSHLFVWHEKIFIIKVKVRRNREYDMDNIAGVYFKIYEMEESSGSLALILKSHLRSGVYERYLSDMKAYEGLRSFVVAKASKSMDEIIAVCLFNKDTSRFPLETLRCISFVVNMEQKSIHFFPAETCDKLIYLADELYILEYTDSFLIAVNNDNTEDDCMIVGSYVYLSRELNLVSGLPHPEERIKDLYKYHIFPEARDVPMISGDSSLWYFYEVSTYHSQFCNVRFHRSDDGKFQTIATEHPPHPFTTLVSALETKVNTDIFQNLKPSCFLG